MGKPRTSAAAAALVLAGWVLTACSAPQTCNGADAQPPSIDLRVSSWVAAHPGGRVKAKLDGGQAVVLGQRSQVSAVGETGDRSAFELTLTLSQNGTTSTSTRSVRIPVTTEKTACGPEKHQAASYELTTDGKLIAASQ